jgi:hypothetical protein
VSARHGGIVDYHVIIREPADRVETNFEGYLLAAVEKPTLRAGLLHRDITGSECLEVAGVGTQRYANFAGDCVATGSMFHATASGTKCVAAGVAFEVNA